jgi:CARDB
MGVHDDDILDFDFVDEATRELPAPPRGSQPHVPREGGGGGGGPRRPQFNTPQGLTPLLRLLGLVVFAIALVVLLAVWAQGCAGDDAQTTYGTYSTEIAAVGGDSAKIGQDLATTLTTPGLEQADLETKLGGLIQRQQLDVQRARELDPPGPLTPAHQHAIEALEFRVSGLQGMLQAFVDTKDGKDQAAAGQLLAAQGQRLQTSDIVWRDLFQGTFAAQAKKENADVSAPASVFVENADLFSSRSMSAIWQRIHGASTGGTPTGIHGNMLAYTKATPANIQLSTQTETTLTVSTDLGFEVGVTNSGGEQEVQVEVTLTIPKQPNPIVKTATIDLIDPGETKVVVFKDFPDVPFGEGTTVQVSVKPVPGETKTDNNSAEYPVVFTLTP